MKKYSNYIISRCQGGCDLNHEVCRSVGFDNGLGLYEKVKLVVEHRDHFILETRHYDIYFIYSHF